MLITVFGPPTIMPSPLLQLRFAVRFTTPLTTCPHAAFDDDACAAIGVVSCCAAAMSDPELPLSPILPMPISPAVVLLPGLVTTFCDPVGRLSLVLKRVVL